MKNQWFVPMTLLAVGFALGVPPVRAQDYSNIRIVRLSFVEGTVQYQRPGQDWQDAGLNLPIQEGFALRTTDGYAEVEFEESLTLHLATNSTVEFSTLALQNAGRVTRLTVPEGTAIVTAKLRRGDEVSVSAANLNLSVPRNVRFRVDVSPEESWVTVLHGKLEVEPPVGKVSFLGGGHTLHLDAKNPGSLEVAGNPPQDDFDKWVSHREDAMNSARSATSDVFGTSTYTEGFADLYDYGTWSYIPGYGAGWMPYGVGAGWMPFMDGQWQFMGGMGLSWMSGEPWGWLPYHFGSWVNTPGVGWAWLPIGPSVWRPANASWVRVNNQLGWVPNGPPLSSKPTRTQLAAIPSTVILANQSASGAIRAGGRMPLAQAEINAGFAHVPPPSFSVSTTQSMPGAFRANPPANAKGLAQSAPSLIARGTGAPASLRAPSSSFVQMRMARLSSMPHAVMAPHSMPAPTIARGASAGGFRGGVSGMRGGSSAGMMSASPAARGATMGAASHSGGGMHSSGGHR